MKTGLVLGLLHGLGATLSALVVEMPPPVVAREAMSAMRLINQTDVTNDIPQFEAIIKAAYAVLQANYDDQMHATAPGAIESIGFQHIKAHDALLAAQAIAHRNFTMATKQFTALLRHQWSNGFMPDVIYGPSVSASSAWLATNKTYYPGPAFWSISEHNNDTNKSLPTSGLLAPPLHAETAMRIFYLAPLDTSMGTPVYTDDAMVFLCDVYSPLRRFHDYLFSSRQASNDSLLVLRHPWESMTSVAPGWKDALASVKLAADYAQVIKRLNVPATAQDAYVAAASRFYPRDTSLVKDLYEPMLYLANCFVRDGTSGTTTAPSKCATDVHVFDVEFNAIVLRSSEALLNMATLLLKHASRSLRFDCKYGLPHAHDIDALQRSVAALKARLQSPLPDGLWNASAQYFQSSHTTSPTVQGFFPLYATALKDTVQIGLLSHILPTPHTFNFFCDYFPMAVYPCQDTIKDVPRITLLVHSYVAYRGFLKNSFLGVAQVLLQKTYALLSSVDTFHFCDEFDATSGAPLTTTTGLSSTLAASVAINMGLPDATQPPSPDTPPINRKMILIVMCIELVVAMGVAIGCVVFSIYFVVKRPQEVAPRPAAASTPNVRVSDSASSPNSDHLEESLLSEDEDVDEYGSFLASSPREPKGTWSSIKSFVSSISPWG
ncbi:hypothetical protein SDRG_01924 [Saprolegnia diclina VS20]|uniref:Mannosylglycerate hydrolase MGH1-like glycoside hydrolase domain-containing protein n=1 Tax=Saprolegnia diclina (strain VS20) TaxID=1156394 RepID=T0S6Q7_SAPDV|nr:hypothetical protein SDRG_01924 [Saprolegnia diclina VS20]EQC40858.1 hypothetical protein SDRG_01924 [Saprolegnia diclina VS20]|eukprot:XP_008605702.1 hypothetical protein SDRG_01924 [Saprolegnia diclina VS20]